MKTQVQVFVNPEEIPQGSSPASLLREKAEKEGMGNIMNHWIRQRFLFQCSNQTVFNPEKSDLLMNRGRFEIQKDPMTNMFSQTFYLEATFVPVQQLAGSILKLKDNRTLAGQGVHVVISLFEIIPDAKGAYFLVARKEQLDTTDYMRIIGSGKIYHSIDHIAQGIFLETSREIMEKDYVFLLLVDVKPRQETLLGVTQSPRGSSMDSIGSGFEEVTIEPHRERQTGFQKE
jgi:hypothetical protein